MIPITMATWFLAALLFLFLRALLHPRKRYPPGPTGLPILGNIRELLAGHWYETFTNWQKLYGDIVFAPSPGQSTYIINSYQLAEEVLGKGLSSSGRPYSRMTCKLMHWDWVVSLMAPSKEWSQIRSCFRQAIGPQMMPGYRPLIYNRSIQLIKAFINFEGDPTEKIEVTIGNIINRMAYGNEIFEEHGSEILEMNREGLKLIAFSASRFWWVDLFPPMQYIPSWFPGATFQRIAKRSSVVADYIRYEPWRLVLDRLRRPEGYEECIATRLIEKEGEKNTIRDAIAVMYAAGAATTTTAIRIFLLCIMLHPEAQQRVHEELDHVVGSERLPTYEDCTSLAYLQAAWKEASRWRPVAPLAFTHLTTEDQTFRGYWVPKGSLIIPNTGFMLRDTQVWDSPELYWPERFLVPLRKNQPDPSIGFGYGRRVCPGRFFADEAGLAVAVMILWAFHIERIERPASPAEVEWIDSSISGPVPFRLRFRPRADKIHKLLENI